MVTKSSTNNLLFLIHGHLMKNWAFCKTKHQSKTLNFVLSSDSLKKIKTNATAASRKYTLIQRGSIGMLRPGRWTDTAASAVSRSMSKEVERGWSDSFFGILMQQCSKMLLCKSSILKKTTGGGNRESLMFDEKELLKVKKGGEQVLECG